MKNNYFKLGLLAACSMTVIASGGAPAPVVSGTTPDVYELLNSNADATSTLSGSAQQTNNTTGARSLVTISGSVKHDTGKTILNSGIYELTDEDGLDANKVLSDGSSTVSSLSNFTGEYKYVRAYQQNFTKDGVAYDSRGVAGIATKTTDMPSSSTASYTGEAEAVVVTNASGFDLKTGVSTVSADFGSGKVSVTLNGFTATNLAASSTATSPIDQIKVTDMTIATNGFTGGTVTTSLAGTDVNILGASASSDAKGNFFGLTNSAPAEVGGQVLMQGDDAVLKATYIAK